MWHLVLLANTDGPLGPLASSFPFFSLQMWLYKKLSADISGSPTEDKTKKRPDYAALSGWEEWDTLLGVCSPSSVCLERPVCVGQMEKAPGALKAQFEQCK